MSAVRISVCVHECGVRMSVVCVSVYKAMIV
jgi:hypothetical protein